MVLEAVEKEGLKVVEDFQTLALMLVQLVLAVEAGVQEVMEVMEKNFQVVQRMREQQSAFGKDVATGCDKGNTAAAMEKGAPLLEEALREPLSHLVEVAEKDPKNHILQTRKKEYDFDLMINKLLLYKNTIGNGNNCNVPCSYNDKQLARWVDNLRSKRRKLIESHNIDNTKPLFDKHLTEERVAALDGIGFVWNDTRERVPWEQRFQELCRWKEEHGHANVPRHSGGKLGEWVSDTEYDFFFCCKYRLHHQISICSSLLPC